MAPERTGHVVAKTATSDALSAAVKIDATALYEPDALVFRGAMPPRNARAVVDAVIVVEVLSPTTGRHDRGGGLIGDVAVPGLHRHFIVGAERRILVQHARRNDEIATRILRRGSLVLDPPGLTTTWRISSGPRTDPEPPGRGRRPAWSRRGLRPEGRSGPQPRQRRVA